MRTQVASRYSRPIAGDNGTVLFANNDASNVMQLDPSTGLAKVVHRDTNTGGAVSRRVIPGERSSSIDQPGRPTGRVAEAGAGSF
jgi:hypothetical protein